MRRQIFIFFLTITTALGLKAQVPSRFLLYGVKDGLSQNSVHAIFRSRDGLVWIGTQDGINSFDGKNFTTYRHDDGDSTSISDQFITAIKEDAAGDLWIGTRNGLNKFDKRSQHFTHYYIREEEKHTFQSEYTFFYPQTDHQLVIRNQNGLFIFDPSSGKSIKISDASSNKTWFIGENYNAWLFDEQHQFYFCPDLRKKEFISFGKGPFPADTDLTGLSMQLSGNQLVFFSQGSKEIFVVDKNTYSLVRQISSPSKIIGLYTKPNGEIYICTSASLYKTTANSGSEMIQITGLPPGPVLSVFPDNEQNIWVGTSTIGFAVNNKSFENFRLVPPPALNDIVSCFAISNTDLFAGCRSGLYRSEEFSSNISPVDFKSVFTGKPVTALCADPAGNIWAAVQGEGLWICNNKGSIIKKIPATEKGIPFTVLSMIRAASGKIMICTVNGFYIADPLSGELTAFSEADKQHPLSGSYTMSAFDDHEGNIWIATNNGLDVYSSGLIKKYSFKSSDDKSSPIKRTIITSVTQDNAGKIWIGTIRNGIYVFAGGAFSHYTTSSGLASDVVYNVISDSRGRVWATTSAGLNIFDEKQNAFVTLATADGVPSAAYIFGAAASERSSLVLGTSEGLLFCDADKINIRTNRINAFITDVKVNGKSIDKEKNEFDLRADGKLITFEFGADPAFFYGNIIYQYRLRGAGDEWITLPRGIHSVSYTGLPYRRLEMEVRAAGAEINLDAAKVFSVSINSKAPFWKTTGFLIAAAFMLISFLALLIFEYNKRNYKKQLQTLMLEKELQNERMRIGRDLHDNIGAYTSAMIAGLNHIKSTDEDQQNHISDLKEYGANIMSFLRETIWMLNTETLTVTAFADRLKNYAIRIGKGYPAVDFRFHEEITDNKSLMPGVMLNLFRILQEALQNACKHAEASAITICVKSINHLCFEIKDNGKGFSPEIKEGHYGLDNMRERAEEAGYIFSIKSGDSGSTVLLEEKKQN